MFYELLLIGTLWFWLPLAVVTIAIIILLHNRCEGGGIFLLGVFLLAWLLVGDLGAIVKADPWRLVWYSLGYVGIGLAWCFPKWVFFLDKIKRQYQEKLAAFLLTRKTDDVGPLCSDDWEAWSGAVSCNPFYDAGLSFSRKTGKLTPPQFHNNKERISGWAVLWPWSILDTLLSDIIKRVYDWVIELYQRLFQAISDWMFRGL